MNIQRDTELMLRVLLCVAALALMSGCVSTSRFNRVQSDLMGDLESCQYNWHQEMRANDGR